jgi:hypothetical protein
MPSATQWPTSVQQNDPAGQVNPSRQSEFSVQRRCCADAANALIAPSVTAIVRYFPVRVIRIAPVCAKTRQDANLSASMPHDSDDRFASRSNIHGSAVGDDTRDLVDFVIGPI